MQVPEVERVALLHVQAHHLRRDRVLRPHPVRDDVLDAVQGVGAVAQPLIQQDLRPLDLDLRVQVCAIHVVKPHRAVRRVGQALRHFLRIAARDRGIEHLERGRA